MASTISAKNLTFSYNAFSPPCLVDLNLNLAPGSRTILVGANGGLKLAHFLLEVDIDLLVQTAGKSTLLQLLAGKRLISMAGAELKVKGCDVFRDSPSGVTFLGTEWSLAK